MCNDLGWKTVTVVTDNWLFDHADRISPRSAGSVKATLPVRELNFHRENDLTHYGQTVKDASRIELIWNQLKETSSFDRRRKELAYFNEENPNRKRGIAITPVKLGIAFTANFLNQAGALVLMYRDGSVQVNHGGTEMRQGLHTKIRQIAAQSLGVQLDRVRVMPTRTDKVPNTSPTAASAGTDLNGAAVLDACNRILARLRAVAAELLECSEHDIHFEGILVVKSCHTHNRHCKHTWANSPKATYEFFVWIVGIARIVVECRLCEGLVQLRRFN